MPSVSTPDTTTQNRRGSPVRRAKPHSDVNVPILVQVPDFTERKEDDASASLDNPLLKMDVPDPGSSTSDTASTSTLAAPSPDSPPKTPNQSEAGSIVWQFVVGGALLGCFVLAYVLLSNSNNVKSKDPDDQIPIGGLEIEYPDNLRLPSSDTMANEKNEESSSSVTPRLEMHEARPTPAEVSPVQHDANDPYPTTDPATYPPTYEPLDGQELNVPEAPESANTQPPANDRRGVASLIGTIKAPPRVERK